MGYGSEVGYTRRCVMRSQKSDLPGSSSKPGTPEKKFKFLSFASEGYRNVSGDMMIAVSAKMEGKEAGQAECEFLFENQHLIPEDQHLIPKVYPRQNRLVFTGYRHSKDRRAIMCLCWYGDKWVVNWGHLDDGYWFPSDRVVRLCE
jgi:hypothetical protein